MTNKHFRALAAGLALALAAGCSAQEEPEAVETQDPSAAPQAKRTALPEMLPAEQFASLAREEMGAGNSWNPGTQITISGVVVNTILDEPPETYLAFGRSPTDVDVYAAMEQPFGQDMQYARPEFTGTDGSSTVACTGMVTRADADSPLLIEECYPVFN